MKFTEILDQYHIAYAAEGSHHHVMSGWVGLDCPFCGEEGTQKWHLGYSLSGRYCSCWQCGYHKPIEVLIELTKESPATCFKLLGGLDFEKAKLLPPRGKLVYPKGLGPLKGIHRQYLKSRGYNPETLVKLWGLMGIGLASKFAWSVFIPIHMHGEVVSWTTRFTVDEGPRYGTAKPEEERLASKSLLYGEDFCRHSIIIVEGPTDVWRIGPGAVATLGIQYTREQVIRIAKFPIRTICFDSEPKAQMQAKKLCRELAVFPGKTQRVELDASDPGCAKEKELQKLREMV